MEQFIEIIAVVLGAYLIGSIPTGYIIRTGYQNNRLRFYGSNKC